MGYTAINKILNPSLNFNSECNGNCKLVIYRNMGQEDRGFSGTRNVMDGSKMSRSFFIAKVKDKRCTMGYIIFLRLYKHRIEIGFLA